MSAETFTIWTSSGPIVAKGAMALCLAEPEWTLRFRFFSHLVPLKDGGWVEEWAVSEVTTGFRVAGSVMSRADAVREAKELLERVGEAAFIAGMDRALSLRAEQNVPLDIRSVFTAPASLWTLTRLWKPKWGFAVLGILAATGWITAIVMAVIMTHR